MRIGKKETIIVVIIGLIIVGGFVVNLLFGIGIGTFRVEQSESEGTIPASYGLPVIPPEPTPVFAPEPANEIPGYPLIPVLI